MNKPDISSYPEFSIETASDSDTLRYFDTIPHVGDLCSLRCTGVEQTDKGKRYTFKYFVSP
jgi:hypothetical protein